MHIEEVNLKHDLTDLEMAALARTQSQALGRKAAAESELGAIKKDFAGRIALAQAEVQNCSQSINTGWEMRNIKCLLVDERPEGWRLIIRTDNGHIAKRRRLEAHERQTKLFTQEEAEAQPQRRYVASALLHIDDPDWHEVDAAQVPLYADEVELLKDAKPPIQFMEAPGRSHRQIEAPSGETGAPPKRGRGRPRSK